MTEFADILKREVEKVIKSLVRSTGSVDLALWNYKTRGEYGPLGETLESAVGSSAAFVAVLSNHYLLSEACGDEWRAFIIAGPNRLDSDLYLVEKEPIDNPLPEPLSEKIRARFIESEGGRERRIDWHAGPGGQLPSSAIRKVEDLATSIGSRLVSVSRSPENHTSLGKKVYLALSPEGGPARTHRDLLVGDLSSEFEIVPDAQRMPDSASSFRAILDEELPSCGLFVQVLDRNRGEFLSTSPEGFVGAQWQAATDSNIKRILMCTPECAELGQSLNDPYAAFVAEAKSDPNAMHCDSYEALLIAVRKEPYKADPGNETARVPCILTARADGDDMECLEQVHKAIQTRAKDMEVIAVGADQSTRPTDLHTILKSSQGIILLYKTSNPETMLRLLIDSVKSPAAALGVAYFDPPKAEFVVEGMQPLEFYSDTPPSELGSQLENYVERLRTQVKRK